eukprot:6172976-Pleurochrysis_carterae.AAC.3
MSHSEYAGSAMMSHSASRKCSFPCRGIRQQQARRLRHPPVQAVQAFEGRNGAQDLGALLSMLL